MESTRSIRKFVSLALVVGGLTLAAAPSASAGALLSSLGTCPTNGLSQPFKRWLDYAYYRYAPGGSFELGQPVWSTSGGAKLAPGNEPWYVGTGGDRQSLYLPGGSVAQSPATCVTIDQPTIRFFAKASSTSLTSQLLVYALSEDSRGNVTQTLVGALTASSSWTPTPVYPLVVANLLALLPNNQTPMAFRLVAKGTASWSVDDFFVDPKRR